MTSMVTVQVKVRGGQGWWQTRDLPEAIGPWLTRVWADALAQGMITPYDDLTISVSS